MVFGSLASSFQSNGCWSAEGAFVEGGGMPPRHRSDWAAAEREFWWPLALRITLTVLSVWKLSLILRQCQRDGNLCIILDARLADWDGTWDCAPNPAHICAHLFSFTLDTFISGACVTLNISSSQQTRRDEKKGRKEGCIIKEKASYHSPVPPIM